MTKEQLEIFKNMDEREKEQYLMNLIISEMKGANINGLQFCRSNGC